LDIPIKYRFYKGTFGKIAPNIMDRDFTTTVPFQKWRTGVSFHGENAIYPQY